jgi:hypothetical protein
MYYSGKPIIHNDFYIFKNAIITDIQTSDCNDTVNGFCTRVKNVEQCIDMCKSGKCKNGYFISEKDGGICVPLIPTDQEFYYRLTDKNIHKELTNKNTFVFSTIQDTYPPDDTNILYYNDNFELQNLKTGDFMTINDDGNVNQYPMFSDTSKLSLQFIESKTNNVFTGNYKKIKNGDHVIINIPNTAMVLRKDPDSDRLIWKLRASFSNVPANVFEIYAINKNNNDTLTYDDDFYFKHQGSLVHFNSETKSMDIINLSLHNALEKSNIIFKLKPRIQMYTFDGQKCKKTSSKNGNIFRSPNCWGLNKKYTYINPQIKIIILILILISIIICCF